MRFDLDDIELIPFAPAGETTMVPKTTVTPIAIPPSVGHGSVYLAGPVTGLSYGQARYGWRAQFAGMLIPGIRVLSPMRHENATFSEIAATDASNFKHKAKAIFQKDMLDIRRADVLFANLINAGDVCAKGTLVEIGAAWALGKFIVVALDPGSLHDYPFITEPAGAVVHNLGDAASVINSLLSEGI